MTLPFTFPDWVPWWAQLFIVVCGLLVGLAFALMPFSVFGLKSRLDTIEQRLDEIQGEIRRLALRLPEEPRGISDDYEAPVLRARVPLQKPPIPPAAWEAERKRAEPTFKRK